MGQGKSREIRTKINSVENTEKITKAMKLVSASKLNKASVALNQFKPYFGGVSEVLAKIAGSGLQHKLTEANKSKVACVVLYSGERSLCGAYNANAIQMALSTGAELEGRGFTVEYIAIGKKGGEALRLAEKNVVAEHNLSETIPSQDYSFGIARGFVDDFNNEKYGEIHLVFTEFKSAASKYNRTVQLLPFQASSVGGSQDGTTEGVRTHYFFEPSKEEILEDLFTLYMEGKIHEAFLQSLASEYGSRMVAMDNASRNAKELISSLTLQLNRARQAAITQEIAEIVGGAASLE